MEELLLMKADINELESLIISYNSEQDSKKKHVLYLNLVEESLNLVNKIVSGTYPIPQTVSREDLVQVGAIGLLKSISTYKIQEKGSFKTYATKFIKGKILQYLRDKANLVKPPRDTVENISIVKKYIDNLESGKNIDILEISKATNIPANKVEDILNADLVKNIISLDQKVYSTDGIETIADRIQDNNDNDFEYNFENKKIIEYALNKLPASEKLVIYKFYINEQTKKSIADELKVSQTQVARLLKRALNKMYDIITNDMKYEEDL